MRIAVPMLKVTDNQRYVGITGFEPITSASEADVLTDYTAYPNYTSILRLVTHLT